ncbi:MAG: DUF389 domain-containing protein [Bacteroidia bacterium]|nr:DUF389 domain-containing protein [Bacteroidia bacterium]NNF30633.1 DUF389 domain-containing protein [Flavobacteriaceae bacterium]MBT8276300.1 DUF389 domain-containing protein [Bacteroidia bacterium]NNJ81737.1 DUF389 domain-containing protein [Flavobacteriaceae bacterium]NNK53193.1 DUF389 domain-containing protein [Flavobacteriaceae bacterium]
MNTSNNRPNSTPTEEEQFEHLKLSTWASIKKFFSELLDIRSETDRDATITAVKKDISFKGHNAWILIFSIFVASIGLNVSSTAVVIGAMLISPLMGPIVGVGLAVAINDVETLRRSLINLGVMIGLSVLTAFLYFKISPLTEETPELLARTYPTILDVLVAIFGGLALIVAKTKSGTIASVIFGVAIATALMPPLCTVGYGLAIGNLNYAGGAIYLFSINTVFIALSTFIVAKLLRFPLVRYANSRRRRLISRVASLIALIVMVPSVILFLNLLDKQVYENRTKEFVRDVINYDGAEVVKYTFDYPSKEIEVYLIGRLVPQGQLNKWQTALGETEQLEGSKLNIYQGSDQSGELAEKISGDLKEDILEDLYVNNQKELRDKDLRIEFLEDEITKLKIDEIEFATLSKEVQLNYDKLISFSYSKRVMTNFTQIDTIPVFEVDWDRSVNSRTRRSNNEKLANWLKFKLSLDTLLIEER